MRRLHNKAKFVDNDCSVTTDNTSFMNNGNRSQDNTCALSHSSTPSISKYSTHTTTISGNRQSQHSSADVVTQPCRQRLRHHQPHLSSQRNQNEKYTPLTLTFTKTAIILLSLLTIPTNAQDTTPTISNETHLNLRPSRRLDETDTLVPLIKIASIVAGCSMIVLFVALFLAWRTFRHRDLDAIITQDKTTAAKSIPAETNVGNKQRPVSKVDIPSEMSVAYSDGVTPSQYDGGASSVYSHESYSYSLDGYASTIGNSTQVGTGNVYAH